MRHFRTDFPWVQNSGLIYLDSAATTHKPQVVLDAMQQVYAQGYAPVHRGIYPAAETATQRQEAVRAAVAKFIHAADPTEIVFTKNCTEGLNLVALAWGRSQIKAGDEILVSALEHHSNLVPWLQLAKDVGAQVRTIPVYDTGELDLSALDLLITSKTKLLALTLSSNIIGPTDAVIVRKLISAAHAVGARVVLDAAQVLAHHELDVQVLGAEFVAFSSHKMFGPAGIGVLYIKKSEHAQLVPVMLGGGMVYAVDGARVQYRNMPHLLEAGTPDIVGIIGLGAAIKYIENVSYKAIAAHETELMAQLLAGLQKFPGVELLGSPKVLAKGHLVCFNVRNHPHDVAAALAQEGICVRAGDHCSQPLHKRFGVAGSVRVSIALYTTQADIAALLAALERIVKNGL